MRFEERRSRKLRACTALLVPFAAVVPVRAHAQCGGLPSIATVVEVDRQTKSTVSFPRERELRDFALFAYRNLAGDIFNRRGPYLEALEGAFAAVCKDRVAFTAWLRDLLLKGESATDFARYLVVAHDQAENAAVAPK